MRLKNLSAIFTCSKNPISLTILTTNVLIKLSILLPSLCAYLIFKNIIQHCFITRSLDSTESEDAGIEPKIFLSLHGNQIG